MPPPMTTTLYWDFMVHKLADAMTINSLYVVAESRKALWVLPVILMIGSYHTYVLDLCTGPMHWTYALLPFGERL